MTIKVTSMYGYKFYVTTNKLPRGSKYGAYECWLHMDGWGRAEHIFGSMEKITKEDIQQLDAVGYFDFTKEDMAFERDNDF